MADQKIFNWLERKQKEYRHNNLSKTLNWVLRQNIMLEKIDIREDKPADQPTPDKFVGDKILKDILNKKTVEQ